MQTFLPYLSFTRSLKCLDYRRLGKQRVEAFQILEILKGKQSRWKNHPAVLMWRGYEAALEMYKNCAISEWILRGYNNTMKITNDFLEKEIKNPLWLNEEFCRSHRSNLLRKNYNFYSQYGWKEPTDLPYLWPIMKNNP